MDIFGKKIQCECGKTHQVEPGRAVYARGAVAQMPELCSRATGGRRAAVLMDARTREIAGRQVCDVLRNAGWSIFDFVTPDPSPAHSPVCDDDTRDWLAARIPDVDLLVPVGGGVMTDLSRWIALGRKIAFAPFATAASMNGYASASVAGTVRGVKSLIYAQAPKFVACDPDIIANAPWELTASGLADVVAKPVSNTDWYLNHVLFGDYYCKRAVNLITEIEPLYRDNPEGLKARDPKAMEALFSSLLLTGVAMNMAETSAPCSGGEHVISHALDMMASRDKTDHDLHGRQVGIGTILAAEIYRRVLATESPVFNAVPCPIDRSFWGWMADGVAEQYQRKAVRVRQAAETLSRQGEWDRLRATLSPLMRTPDSIRDCLKRADAAYKAEHIRCDRKRLLEALLHAHEIRDRFTILDLARGIGVMPAAAEEIVETWA